MTAVTLSNITAGYGKSAFLHDISLTAPAASITTVIGPNGSGKSTLLKVVAGTARCTSGSLLVAGADLTTVSERARVLDHRIAYVPQLSNVFAPMTILENLEIGGITLPRRTRRRRMTEILGMYPDLARRPHARADSLSGGQRQLLAMARALMPEPAVLLLDELSAGLSPRLLDELFESVRDLCHDTAVTVLLVEQNAHAALRISDRGVVLVAGQIARAGAACEIADDPTIGDLYLGTGPAPEAGQLIS
ncbi:ABC transporter ATP-binding protein [Nocardia crassostreae]|uniref:ABC transporter ATP-binding protein n=1 Tax=Nocardia crassostreae TaxID=53428 RepID=UPI00082B2B3F|nr:ABC transporter ATP-binding protein [Nocardia crassostreae]